MECSSAAEEDIRIFCLNEAINLFVMASSMCWYGHVFKREDGHWSMMLWIKEEKGAEEDIEKQAGLSREDVLCQSKWTVPVNEMATRLR